MEHRYFIKFAFNGSGYHGWQVQDNAATVQQALEKALSLIIGDEIQVMGAGRTDTGVHARQFYAHFDFNILDRKARRNLINKLNRFFADDIVVYDILPVVADAHARFSALSRTYQYQILKVKDPFLNSFAWYIYGDLDVALMNKGAQLLFDYEDFTSFSKLHTQVKTNNCKVMSALWEEQGPLLIFTITADRFLRNMVRAIVGTLVDLGKHKITLDDFRKIIENKDRSEAGVSVPAKGLFLTGIKYPDGVFLD